MTIIWKMIFTLMIISFALTVPASAQTRAFSATGRTASFHLTAGEHAPWLGVKPAGSISKGLMRAAITVKSQGSYTRLIVDRAFCDGYRITVYRVDGRIIVDHVLKGESQLILPRLLAKGTYIYRLSSSIAGMNVQQTMMVR